MVLQKYYLEHEVQINIPHITQQYMPQTQAAHTYSVHTILALFQTCQINLATFPSFPHFSLDKVYEEI